MVGDDGSLMKTACSVTHNSTLELYFDWMDEISWHLFMPAGSYEVLGSLFTQHFR